MFGSRPNVDLADYAIVPNSWDLIVSIFVHLPRPIRQDLHRKVVRGLCSGGMFVIEKLARLNIWNTSPVDHRLPN